MESPFSFLKEAPTETVELIHKVILGSDTTLLKDLSIKAKLDDKCFQEYYIWTRKRGQTPPSEVLHELTPANNIYLFQMIEQEKWEEIPAVFRHLSSHARRKAEQWYSDVETIERMKDFALTEAKEILIQFMREKEAYSKHTPRVPELVGHFEKLRIDSVGPSTATIELQHTQAICQSSRPTYSAVTSGIHVRGPIVTEANEEKSPSSSFYTTYQTDFPKPVVEEVNEEDQTLCCNNCGRKNQHNDKQIKRPAELEEEPHIQPIDKKAKYDDSTAKLGRKHGSNRNESKSYSFTHCTTTVPPREEQKSSTLSQSRTKKPEKNAATGDDQTAKEHLASCESKNSLKKANNVVSEHYKSAANGSVVVTISDTTKVNDGGTNRSSTPPASQVEQDFNTGNVDPENVFNILLLGETGVGKTTFVNSFANYVKYETMDEALENTPVILMKSSITQTSSITRKDGTTGMKKRRITVEANSEKGHRNSINENFAEGGESRTQEPLIHCIPWHEDGTLKLLRIIDTPGVNDTRGSDQDDINFDKIINLIGQLGNLRAICILLKPNEAKLSLGFRICLDNVLVKLHRSATNNILFCFTNTRSTLYRPGDTMAPLNRYLEDLEKSTGVLIKPNKHNIFCYDNDCFRYMCILMKLPLAKNEKIHSSMSPGWMHNVAECKKLLKKIQGLVAHQVEDTVNINKIRAFLTALARPLTEIAMNHMMNIRIMEKQIQEILELGEKGFQLESAVSRKQMVIRYKPLEYPRTVCTTAGCNDTVCDIDGTVLQVPKNICHDKCTLRDGENGDLPLTYGQSDLSCCIAFCNNNKKCKFCGCSWKTHTHLTYEIERKLENVATLEEQYEFKNCKDKKKRAEITLSNFEKKLDDAEYEYKLIKDTSFEFSAFLLFNSLKTSTDPYLDYLNNAIDIEENLAKHRDDKTLLTDLKSFLADYKKGVEHNLVELKEQRRPPMTSAEIWNKVDNLGRLKLSGSLIADVARTLKEGQQAP